MGLFNIESANAKTLQTEAPTTAPSMDIAQVLVSTIFGTCKLKYSVGEIVYESVLIMSGRSGTMRTRYFNTDSGKIEAVDQMMLLKPDPKGLLILGYNPVYAGTSLKNLTYSPDNFFFSVTPDGSATFINCDDRKQCSPVNVEEIK